MKMHANKREDVDEAYAGEIVAVAGLKQVDDRRHDLRRIASGNPRSDGVPDARDLARHRAEDPS